MRLTARSIAVTLFALSLQGGPAVASDTAPVIVVPGRPGVPVVIDGVDVTGAVLYGDWGLARPGHGAILIDGPLVYSTPSFAGRYYPATGRAPRYGRDEVEPPPHPRPPTNYSRSWTTGSDTTQPVTEYPPFNPPPVIMAPPDKRNKSRGQRK